MKRSSLVNSIGNARSPLSADVECGNTSMKLIENLDSHLAALERMPNGEIVTITAAELRGIRYFCDIAVSHANTENWTAEDRRNFRAADAFFQRVGKKS